MNIARIVTNIHDLKTFSFIEKTNNTANIFDGIPTLIIGKKNAEKIVGEGKIRVLNKNIQGNVYWTFSKTEKRDEFEKDIEWFNGFVIDNIEKDIKYRPINLLTCGYSMIKRLIRFIKSDEEKYIYINDKHIFVYNNGYVIGISLNDLSYIGIKKEKIIDRMNNKSIKLIDNYRFIDSVLKNRANNNEILIPYLFFLKSE